MEVKTLVLTDKREFVIKRSHAKQSVTAMYE